MENLVKDVVELFNNTHWERIKSYPEVHSLDGTLPIPTVHVHDITLLFKDQDYKATERNSIMYPIELSIDVSGVKFFSVHHDEEFTL